MAKKPFRKSSKKRRSSSKTLRHKKLFAALLVLFALCIAFLLLKQRTYEPPADNIGNPLQIAYNCTKMSRTAEEIQYIVVHDTANRSFGANAQSHYEFFNRANQSSSADFFVDDHQILQVNDFYQFYTWHCGDGGSGSTINNQNSIGVEICINQDGNYQRAVDNAVLLVRRLMAELDIDAAHVVRHYDVSHKQCPGTMASHDWRDWNRFLERVSQ